MKLYTWQGRAFTEWYTLEVVRDISNCDREHTWSPGVPTVERRPQDLPGLQGDPQLHRRRLGHFRRPGQLRNRYRHSKVTHELGRLKKVSDALLKEKKNASPFDHSA